MACSGYFQGSKVGKNLGTLWTWEAIVQASWLLVLHAAKTKRNLQLPFANSNLIDASQTRAWRRHLPGQLLSDLPQRE